jgi:peptidyl-prolyl cis-trans isomerase D
MYRAMLEAMRKQSRSVLIYVFFGIIIAVFISTFAPSSEGFASCTGTTGYAARVAGHKVGDDDLRYGFVLAGGGAMRQNNEMQARLRALVMDKLIERELLAAQAEGMGLRIADAEVDDLISSGSILALGMRQDMKAFFFSEGAFDYDLFSKFCQFRLGQSVKAMKEQQRRELLAAKVRNVMRAAVKISDDEVRTDFAARGMQINLEYVRFAPDAYLAEIQPSEADIDKFLPGNRPKIEERYHTRSFRYKGLPKQFRARHILVAVPKDAKPAVEHALRVRAEDLRDKARGGVEFAGLARIASDDAATKALGGELGWRARGESGFGSAFEDAAFALPPGEVSDPVRSPAGWHVIRLEAVREGDQKLEAVQRDIAEDLIREQRAQERARLEAEDRLKRLQAGADWERMFQAEEKTDEGVKPVAPGTLVRRETGLFSRRGATFPQIGISKDLAKDAFDLTRERPLGKRVYDTAGAGPVIVRLKDRVDPDMKDFEQRKAEIAEDYRLAKWSQVLAGFVLQRCRDAQQAGDLHVNPQALGDAERPDYVPCSSFAAQ